MPIVIKALRKYLSDYSEDSVNYCKEIQGSWSSVCTIPIFQEFQNLPALLESLEASAKTCAEKYLVIFVVNARNCSTQAAHTDNQEFIDFFSKDRKMAFGSFTAGAHLDKLVLDFNGKFPSKQGVGLARKIAADLAMALIIEGDIKSPYIGCTDGDARIPLDYFSRLEDDEECSALLFPYQHTHECDPLGLNEWDRHAKQGIDYYHDFLSYYVNGLESAHSPYAYYSIGSTIACHFKAYAEVRGFPKRLAGEDFYLLNKLAKVGKIKQLAGAPIMLQGRPSKRVPFGTGAAVRDIRVALADKKPYLVYHPKVFVELRNFLSCADEFLTEKLQHWPEAYLSYAGPISEMRTDSTSLNQRIKKFHIWFDGFRTLKFIHDIRDSKFPSISIQAARDLAPQLFEKNKST